LFMSVFFTAVYGTFRRQAEEGGNENNTDVVRNFFGRRGRGVAQEIIDSIPVKKWVKACPSSVLSEKDVKTINQSESSQQVDKISQNLAPSNEYGPDEEENECCPICLLDYEEGDEVRTLPCSHEFHKHCVDSWLENNSSCPACRHSVYDSPPNACIPITNDVDGTSDNNDDGMQFSISSTNVTSQLDFQSSDYYNRFVLGRRRVNRNRRWFRFQRSATGHARVISDSQNVDAEESQPYTSTLELTEEIVPERDVTQQPHVQNDNNHSTSNSGRRAMRMRNPSRIRRGIRRITSGGQSELITLNLPLRDESVVV